MSSNGNNFSIKRIAIDKQNASLIVIIGVTIFIVVFSAVSIKALYSQMRYQSKVITKKEAALNQINKNKKEVESLNTAYKEFSSPLINVIGGSPAGSGDRDGDNARIILDALPSKYDYPALLTSLNKLVQTGGYQLTDISGNDDEINQAKNSSSSTPTPVEMPFSLEASVASTEGSKFLQLFERSIRPINVTSLSVQSSNGSLRISLEANTYFQPEKKLNVTEEIVK